MRAGTYEISWSKRTSWPPLPDNALFRSSDTNTHGALPYSHRTTSADVPIWTAHICSIRPDRDTMNVKTGGACDVRINTTGSSAPAPVFGATD